MKKQFKWIWPVLWLVICLFGGGGTLFSWMPRTPGMFYGGYAMLVLSVGAGTVLVNVPGDGILTGGGRDHNIWGNVVINTGDSGISYDQRTFESNVYSTTVWGNLQESPWLTDIWQETYPYLQGLHLDETKADDPLYVLNPANSKVNGNLFVNWQGELGDIADKPSQYSDFSGNAVYTLDMLKKLFVDPDNGDYRLKEDSIVYEMIPDFEDIPVEKIGRE